MSIRPRFPRAVLAAAVCLVCLTAGAQTSIGLQNFQLTAQYALDPLGERGLEASAVTYARDRGTLFFVGDEGLGVVEISRSGQTIGSMAFDWAGTGSTNNDAEGLTYLGNGVLVVAEERLQDAFRFSYSDGGSVALASMPSSSIGPTVGNVGTEGISWDPRDGSFVSVKQDNPPAVLAGGLNFAVGGGTSTMAPLFDADALLGVNSLSDVQTLSPVDALAGSAAADNLLILSLDSRRLIEVTRSGAVLSSLDLSSLTTQALEGLTIDEKGVIYLVAEDSGSPSSRLFVLTSTAPIPEPGSVALMLAGLAALGWRVRRAARQR
jgi:uncharacterized protein YjiK